MTNFILFYIIFTSIFPLGVHVTANAWTFLHGRVGVVESTTLELVCVINTGDSQTLQQ